MLFQFLVGCRLQYSAVQTYVQFEAIFRPNERTKGFL
jgi:hypothetical protein